MESYIYQMEPAFDEDDAREVSKCVRSTWVTEGERTAAFEQVVAEFVGSRFAVAVPSCTAALALSLMALDIGPGDQVIVPDLTFVGTANAVDLAGAIPILADIQPDTFGLDPLAVERAIGPQTRAIIPVWFNGREPGIRQLLQVAEGHGLAVIEDAACALGSWSAGQHAGTFGHIGCLSFNTTKIITTGMGGMVLTDDPKLYECVKRLKNHGRLDRCDYHPVLGFNFCFSDLLAALGLSQMQKLPQRIARKHTLCQWYHDRLDGVQGIDLLPPPAESCLWYPDILVEDPAGLKAFLQNRGIQTRLYFPPIHTQPCYRTNGAFPIAERVSARGIWLPSAPYLVEKDVDRVSRAIVEWAEAMS